MKYFVTALYAEAEGLIQYYKMKKLTQVTKFQVFKTEDEILIVSGVGGIKAAIAATYLLTLFPPLENDCLINMGICGVNDKTVGLGELFLCSKLMNRSTQTDFYPDILYKHEFREAAIQSSSKAVHKEFFSGENKDICLVDMEAAYIYEAAIHFIKAHRIVILKMVSDFLEPDTVKKEDIKRLFHSKAEMIGKWLEQIAVEDTVQSIFSDKELADLKSIAENLKLSVTLEIELYKLAKNHKIRNGSLPTEEYAGLRCESKNEGKKYYGELRSKLKSTGLS